MIVLSLSFVEYWTVSPILFFISTYSAEGRGSEGSDGSKFASSAKRVLGGAGISCLRSFFPLLSLARPLRFVAEEGEGRGTPRELAII